MFGKKSILTALQLLLFLWGISLAGAAPTQSGEVDRQAACDCVGEWETTILAAQQRASCQSYYQSYGGACVSYEIVVTKPFLWDASRSACVGSNEVRKSYNNKGTPVFKEVVPNTNVVVGLAEALTRCKTIGRDLSVSGGDRSKTNTSGVPPRGTAAYLAYLVDQWMIAHPSLEDATRSLRGNDVLLVRQEAIWSMRTASGGTVALPLGKGFPAKFLPILMGGYLNEQVFIAEILPGSERPSIIGEIYRDRLTKGTDFRLHYYTFSSTASEAQEHYVEINPSGMTIRALGVSVVLPSVRQLDRRIVDIDPGTVIGTINGGGDFVSNFAIPGTTPSYELRRIELPGAEFVLVGTSVAIDVAANGVSAVAVLDGEVRARELTTGEFRQVKAGEVAVVLPGFGVAPVQPMTGELRSYIEAVVAAGSRRTTLTSAPSSRILAGGEEWRTHVQAGTPLVLDARLPWKIPAGAAAALELSIDGQIVTLPLSNKGPSFDLADGRTFDYLDSKTGHWNVFYSPDFSANNGPGGGDYRVVTNPGQAYRYVWEIPRPASGNDTVELRIRNALTNISMEVRLVPAPEATGK